MMHYSVSHCRNLIFLLCAGFLASCKPVAPKEILQPDVLKEHCGFDIARVQFTENVPRLFSSSLEIDGAFTSTKDTGLDYSKLIYWTIDTNRSEQVPQDIKSGYTFETAQLDSVARYDSTWFDQVKMLTSKDTVLWALTATKDYKSKKERDARLAFLQHTFGNPVLASNISSEFNYCIYCWQLPDRIIEVNTSFGIAAVASTDTAENGVHNYYKLDILVVRKDKAAALFAMHRIPKEYIWKNSPDTKKYVVEDAWRKDEFYTYSLDSNYLKGHEGGPIEPDGDNR